MFVVGLVKFVNRNMFSVTRRENSKSLTAQRGSKECFTADINTEGTDLLQLSHSMALTQTHTADRVTTAKTFLEGTKNVTCFCQSHFIGYVSDTHVEICTSVQARGIWFDISIYFGLNLPGAFWGETYVSLNFLYLAVGLFKYQ